MPRAVPYSGRCSVHVPLEGPGALAGDTLGVPEAGKTLARRSARSCVQDHIGPVFYITRARQVAETKAASTGPQRVGQVCQALTKRGQGHSVFVEALRDRFPEAIKGCIRGGALLARHPPRELQPSPKAGPDDNTSTSAH
jgi:hypothetical protein